MDYILANLERFWWILTTGGATESLLAGSNLFRANYVAIVGHALT